ncbi:asparagine synthase (glutamine-hydrolyzing) [Methylosinus sporium]|uniref:asparagine synthase (glutamine-hydrolyzing) n=1 Tax=Methylosinus sporium TaxID=428 RepID=A0A549T4K8_METSR|nr:MULTISPECIES: asparagine synthase (glutamine-hydrolyzing) [Methylosinus]MBU3889578.1 asparagine synthase (glutamine-hydrolyzing) [Methylosinus sp. KRF6]TRL36807.1 asparagine synthase (glutamine-hydrolyzing) [Methylosinus sporium]
MCGIAGFLGIDEERLLGDMSQLIAHRGPDGAGQWSDRDAMVGLAHRRLSIIDTSDGAAQPMLSCNDRYVVVFNGEIYNFRELGVELAARGYRFNPNSDTAVIAPLYDLEGEAMLARLNGMFSFALWDRRRRELLIARDSFGVKPLYFVKSGGGLVFASELKALFAYSRLDLEVDLVAIGDYLTHLWSPGERTPLRSVAKLAPGHLLKARRGDVEIRRWHWSAPPVAEGGTENVGAIAGLGRIFDQVVSDQCMSDAPVGAFLSGGVDSSAIVAAMVANGHVPRRTYCVGFEGAGLEEEGFSDDLTHAREVAALLDVPLTPLLAPSPTMQDFETLVYTLDEPEADPAPLYVGAIARAARADGIKVLLGGVGGDDIFSGYRRHRAAAMRARLGGWFGGILEALPPATARVMGPASKRRIEKLRYMFAGSEQEFLIRAFEFNPRESAVACLGGEARDAIDAAPSKWLEQALMRTVDWPLVERMLDLELHGFLPDHNLNYTDKASMAHGVEVRVPFLDPRLVEYARRIPWRLKIRGLSEKWALKKGLGSRLPLSVLKRRKTGFGGPVRLWLAGQTGEMIADLFASRGFRERGLFDVGGVRKAFDDLRSERRDNSYLILAIVMTELWMKRFLDGRSTATAAGRSAKRIDVVAPI